MESYSKVFKPVEDFFKKSFSYDHTVEITAATGAGIKLKGESSLSKGGVATTLTADGYKYGNLSLDKLEVGNAGAVSLDFSLAKVADGTKVTFKAVDSSRVAPAAPKEGSEAPAAGSVSQKSGASSAKLGVTSAQKAFVVDAEVDLVTGPIATVSTVFGVGAGVVGAEASFNTGVYKKDAKFKQGFDLQEYSVLAAYKAAGTTVGARTSDRLANVTLFAFNESGQWTVAASAKVSTRLVDVAKAAKGADVKLGASYKVSDEASVFGAVNSAGKVDFAYKLAVGSAATLTVSSQVDATAIAGDSHRFGTKLALRA